MEKFDFDAPAEVFTAARHKARRSHVIYRRFQTGAEAVRYAIESLATELLRGTIIETDEARFGADDIRALYDSASFPRAYQANSVKARSAHSSG